MLQHLMKKKKELLKENLGEDVINVSALPEPPKEIILEVGQLYKNMVSLL